MSIKLSIGIPVYNQATTIAETIESALNQSQSAFEVVVSDNHSNDGTSEIIQRYADDIKIVRPIHHLSMGQNWNFCARSTTGSWCGLCSGDDTLKDNYVRSFSEAISKHPEVGFAMGGWLSCNEISKQQNPRYLMSMPLVSTTPRTVEMLLKGPKASFAAFCVKRECFEKIGGYDQSFHLIQDWILQFDLAVNGEKFLRVDKLVATYRIAERPVITEARRRLFIEDEINYLINKIWKAKSCGIRERRIKLATNIRFDSLLDHGNQNACSDLQIRQIELIAKRCEREDEFLLWKKGLRKSKRRNLYAFLTMSARSLLSKLTKE